MSLPGRIKQIVNQTIASRVAPMAFMKSQQTANSCITSGQITAINGSNATVQLDNGSTVNVMLTNNQYSYVGARIDVVGNMIAI